MPRRFVHISDLHLGHGGEPEPVAALREVVDELEPDVLVVTGDLTHRGRHADLLSARVLLESFGVPFLAIPGNHDLPYVVPRRFTRPHAEWQRVFGTVDASFTSDALVVVGLNSTRPWRHQGGALAPSELDRLDSAFEGAAPDALRVVALHHHLASPPWHVVRKHPLRRRDHVLGRFASAGVELVLSGHVHQTSIAERREFEFVGGEENGAVVLATVAGFGRPRPERREAVGFNVYEFDSEGITVRTESWAPHGTFVEIGRRRFRRSTAR